jgi:hypothetical protein
MSRAVIAVAAALTVVLLALAVVLGMVLAPAWADFQDGQRAYQRGDYAAAPGVVAAGGAWGRRVAGVPWHPELKRRGRHQG